NKPEKKYVIIAKIVVNSTNFKRKLKRYLFFIYSAPNIYRSSFLIMKRRCPTLRASLHIRINHPQTDQQYHNVSVDFLIVVSASFHELNNFLIVSLVLPDQAHLYMLG